MRGARWVVGCALAALAAAPSASASSLPSVRSGARPGPPLLYAKPPAAPQLSVRAPFRAPPLLVSGTDAYRGGEYLYQDYLFDDRGADTVPGFGNQRDSNAGFSPTAGDVFYPTDSRYAGNAADLVELRIKPTRDAVLYRVTLNTVKDPGATVVGIGIDTDRSGGAQVAWPFGAGVTSPGLDRFITAFGTGGKVTDLRTGRTTDLPRGAVTIDTRTNQMTIRVPRRGAAGMDPGRSTWRYVAGAGLWSGTDWKRPRPATRPTSEEPASGNPLRDAPGVFNLAFRFNEGDLQSNAPNPVFETSPGVGNWFEDGQANALQGGTTGGYHADVDFARLARGANASPHPPGREQARIFASSVPVPEGFRDHPTTEGGSGTQDQASDKNPTYGGQLQPYLLIVPPSYRRATPAGLTWALHSLGATYTQYAVFSPNQLRQFGDERGNLVATTLGRGADGWYFNKAEADVFEVWADIARHFSLDPKRVALTGYSMGGYGTYKLGAEYPDLFGRAFTTVGPPARGVWIPPAPPPAGQFTNTNPLLENVRWVPYLNWVEATDELVPYPGPREQQNRFDRLGLRSQLWTFTPGDHLTLATLDRWDAARDFLGASRVKRDPSRVDYAFMPDADTPSLGLLHDHAYWVSALRVRDRRGDPRTNPARGEIDARSLAYGEGDPLTRRVAGAQPGPPEPSTIDGTEWTSIPSLPRRNALTVSLQNVRQATLDGTRARLSGRSCLKVSLTSDGAGRVRLNLPLPAGARIVRGTSCSAARAAAAFVAAATGATVDRGGATFTVASGTQRYVIVPAARPRGPRFTG